MVEIINGIKQLGFGGFLAYTFFIWFIFILIDSIMLKSIEKLLGMQQTVHWYDVVLLVLWIGIYIYGLYIYGKVVQ